MNPRVLLLLLLLLLLLFQRIDTKHNTALDVAVSLYAISKIMYKNLHIYFNKIQIQKYCLLSYNCLFTYILNTFYPITQVILCLFNFKI